MIFKQALAVDGQMAFLPGVQREPMVCLLNTNSEPSWDVRDGRMKVCREEKKEMLSVSSNVYQGSRK